ncbi:pali-domain-containing protein [Phellopilus nigrolimitatus]|nr:pali-domain-containing protein [Phellopilus nigrolimitatus]
MGLRPATPGFLVTLIATILLAVVSFNVPLLKSVYFLKATLTVENVNGTITLGTLGYCLELSNNGTTCTKPSVGYEFNPNELLGDGISFAQIPTVVVKWITYALFLHVIALCAAALSAFFGLLAHVREMSMTCFSSCISGFAAVIALVAFIFDIVLFFLVKARINSINGGSATIGNAIWLTLAAWVLLFFSGCVYACGRCCASRRPRGPSDTDNSWMNRFTGQNANNDYPEQMRLEAVKAEADRKARQKNEIGLPAFPSENEVTKPLNSKAQYLEESDDEGASPYMDNGGVAGPRRQGSAAQSGYRGGYAQAPPGTSAMDEYYSPTRTEANIGYPPNRQYAGSSRSPPPSSHTQSLYSTAPTAAATPAPQTPAPYLNAAGLGAHSQYPSAQEYGHTAGGTTYHSAISSDHQQYPSAYSQYNDPYSQHGQPQSAFNADTYNQTGAIGVAVPYATPTPPPLHSRSPPPRQATQPFAADAPASQYYTSPQGTAPGQLAHGDYYGYGGAQRSPERSYTLGGGGYGGNVVPDNSAVYGAPHGSPSPMPAINTNVVAHQTSTSPGPMGPRSPAGYGAPTYAPPQSQSQHSQSYEDGPPGYEAGPAQPAGQWNAKR